MSDSEAYDIVENALDKIGEHFSNVQILISWPADGGGTRKIFIGSGDWYARQGLAGAFIKSDEAEDTARAIAREMKKEDEE